MVCASSSIHPYRVLEQLVGLRCRQANSSSGSGIQLLLAPAWHSENLPTAEGKGSYHLTVLAPWRLETAEHVVTVWSCPELAIQEVFGALGQLDENEIVSATSKPPGWDLRIEWKSGHRLVVFGDSDAGRGNAWSILEPDGTLISMGPIIAELLP